MIKVSITPSTFRAYVFIMYIHMIPKIEYVMAHHEKWDGTGYPKGLAGENISWKSRIIAVADAYDAMTSKGPYRKQMNKAEAIEELRKNAGKQFDPDIVDVFINEVLLKNREI